ncbi:MULTISPECIES: response regulator transcription factor [Marinobacter]|jgi:two-component system response regulator PfeR|uniref:Copper-sensing two-component system response regulator CpxR n=1 Tax=Marinobacter excellens LAMA 842 TaxID=1306954 RepID=A0A137SIH3_9GAMM|nr:MULTISPECIES: response regulator transcription factor [Marinobacter]KXO12226.1 Copper-sensing two-component system response regulator CpxR [Marinobacter excellens LAMA 842]MCD1628739.1 response regulator transcription factor [Marinobacter shengliensis]
MSSGTQSRPRILIVEDDQTLSDQLSGLLTSKGYQVQQCFEGDQALLDALSLRLDLILLDVLLPRMNGFDVLERLRKTRQTPVMMLTACGAEEERILGYQQGADDYLPKPFSFTELLLRIEALLRRTLKAGDQRADPTELVVGNLTLNRASLSVVCNGEAICLTPIQFRLLWMLVLHQSEALSKPYLYQVVLEKEFSRYDRSLDMHLSRVRRKLVEAGMAADRLQTVHGRGYCFL